MSDPKKVKIMILSDARSAHTIKWVDALLKSNYSIFLFSLAHIDKDDFSFSDELTVYSCEFTENQLSGSSWKKLLFLTKLPILKKKIKEFQPDILHAHYVPSYGLLGSLCFFKPYILSAWGSDIFIFPTLNLINKWLVKFILSTTNMILSTGYVMKEEIRKYTKRDIYITPFGIDIKKFIPVDQIEDDKFLTIGTIKNLEYNAGIDQLIHSYNCFQKRNANLDSRLIIVGEGPYRNELIELTEKLKLEQNIEFVGAVPYSEVSLYHHKFDIFASISRFESFGVAVLEASACGKPVIVSNAGGLIEVVEDNQTGLIVKDDYIEQTTLAIEKLASDKFLRDSMGRRGREFVIEHFELDSCIKIMISIYDRAIRNRTDFD